MQKFQEIMAKGEAVFEDVIAKVIAKYPQLENLITRSLLTPQIGPHHNEGKFLDSHLKLWLGALIDLTNGANTYGIDEELVILVKEVSGRDIFRLYEAAIFHDIGKPDCMKIVTAENEYEDSFEDWHRFRSGVDNYRGEKIEQIGYYQPSGNGQHGQYAVEQILTGIVADLSLLYCIQYHEVAYQFKKISGATFGKYFGGLSKEEQDFLMVCSLLDTAASIGTDGVPDFSNFMNLWDSMMNYDLVEAILSGKKYRENKRENLLKQDKVLTRKDIEKIIEKDYDKKLLVDYLSKWEEISAEEIAELLKKTNGQINAWLGQNMKNRLGKKIGPFMGGLQKCKM